MCVDYAYYVFYGCILTKEEFDKLTNIPQDVVHKIGSNHVIIAFPDCLFKNCEFTKFYEEDRNAKFINFNRTNVNRQLFQERIANKGLEVVPLVIMIGKPFQEIFCEIVSSTLDNGYDECITKRFLLA